MNYKKFPHTIRYLQNRYDELEFIMKRYDSVRDIDDFNEVLKQQEEVKRAIDVLTSVGNGIGA